MAIEIVYAGHFLVYIVATSMRIVIYKYVKKKPLGLQSALDPLIIDLVQYQMLNHTLFIFFLVCGLFHGHLPYIPSQILVLIIVHSSAFILSTYQFFLIVKAIIIFKGSLMENISDDKLVILSRVFAFVYTIVKAIGDYIVTKPKTGPMITFLTGTSVET